MALKFLSRGTLKGEKLGLSTSPRAPFSIDLLCGILVRFFQFILAITVIGLYAQDLQRAHKSGHAYDSKWMYATVVGSLAAFWAALCVLSPVKAWFLYIVDFVVMVLYIAAFGLFGKIYINQDAKGVSGVERMKNAVWVLLANVFLWFGTFVYGAVVFWKYWKGRTTFTGRAPAHASV